MVNADVAHFAPLLDLRRIDNLNTAFAQCQDYAASVQVGTFGSADLRNRFGHYVL
jgi:hypothetical protein